MSVTLSLNYVFFTLNFSSRVLSCKFSLSTDHDCADLANESMSQLNYNAVFYFSAEHFNIRRLGMKLFTQVLGIKNFFKETLYFRN